MASANATNAEAERVFNRAQLKLNLNLPPIDSPRSLSELQSMAQEIQRQKDEVLAQLKHEDKDRHSYFTQLEHLARQMRELPLPTDSPSLEYELERKRLELETQRMQDMMAKTLGPTSEVVRRREERILHLRKLDQRLAEINSLITSHANKTDAQAARPDPQCDEHELARSAVRQEWTNDKDIWLSGSSLDLHLEEKNGHSDTASVMSFTSSVHSSHGIAGSGSGLMSGRAKPLMAGPKVEVVYNLLTMLFSHDRHNVSQKLLHMSANAETRATLHQVGCIPLLVQLIYNQDGGNESSAAASRIESSTSAISWMLSDEDKQTRASAAQALHNLVYNGADERKVKREMRILKLLELIRTYADRLREAIAHQLHHHEQDIDHRRPVLVDDDMESHPCAVVTNLMKLSFDDDHRQAMSHLGALQGLSELLHLDQLAHGSLCDRAQCTTLRRYASMTLTNLTFGHGPNKSLLCSTRPLLSVLAHQLASPNDDLRQVTASVLRNLSWRADTASKDALQQAGVVESLISVAMETVRESTLKSMLSALWNLSSHSSANKATICATAGSLEFLVRTLAYKSESKTLAVVESGGGVLRNISSHVATRDDYRAVLRQQGCLQILLHHLRSPSLTVVSNACGTLWNLSARCKEDQGTLRDLGAIPMLRSLVHSRHKLIATASAAALKNLDSFGSGASPLNSSGGGHNTSLQARKQKALEQEIDQTLTEMCDNIDPLSPLEPAAGPFDRRMYRSLGGHNTTSQYGRSSTAPTLVPKSGSTPIRQVRSSSLERKSSGGGGGGATVVRAAVTPTGPAPGARLQVTRTVWHSHENEISYSSLNYEEDDQPVNYSLKYTEEVGVASRWVQSRPANASNQSVNDAEPKTIKEPAQNGDQMDSATVKKALVLSAYRETDLDEPEHPTDFSLRYQEEDDYAADNDTMQTYCMEGTPYETPFTRSSAASLTDLREAGLEGPKPDEEGAEPYGDKDEGPDEEQAPEVKVKIVDEEEADEGKGGKTPPMPRRPPHSASKEGKTVTFNTTAEMECNYAEQTPLMFSRSSSLASLDSLDHHQNCADEGSVVSEFSRLTSRAVSPSELPDSPGQTMPSSPRRPEARQPPPQAQQAAPVAQPKPVVRQPEPNVFEDATNDFGIEGTPAFTRAASPLSQLSFDDGDEPSPPPPPPPPPASVPVQPVAQPPVVRPVVRVTPVPNTVPVVNSQVPLMNPALNRVVRSSSEVNFRSTFDYDEARRFNEEDSPALTRCTSLSSLHVDGEVISTAKLPPVRGVGNLTSSAVGTERKSEVEVKVEVVSVQASVGAPVPMPVQSAAEWSEEESGSEDDLLLEDIISLGMPSSRQSIPSAKGNQSKSVTSGAPPAPALAGPSGASLVAQRPPMPIPKSASAHSIGQASNEKPVAHSRPAIPPSKSTDSSLAAKASVPAARDSASDEDVMDDDDDADDEMLYACIKSAKPTAKPVPPPRTSSMTSSRSSSAAVTAAPAPPMHRSSRPSRPPMELPKQAAPSAPLPAVPSTKERVPPLHGPFANVKQFAVKVKSTFETVRSSGRRSRHSSQGSSRMGASGCSNNTSVDLDSRHSYRVEDTPVTFSRNSSLSSLSVSSNDDEPSAEDQALLDNCISWGMPKSKSDGLKAADAAKSKSAKQPAKIPNSQSWSGSVRRAGDGQASVSSSALPASSSSSALAGQLPSVPTSSASSVTAPSVSSNSSAPTSSLSSAVPPTPASDSGVGRVDLQNGALVDPSDVYLKMSDADQADGPPSMTHSSLIRIEANKVAAHIQSEPLDSLEASSLLYMPASDLDRVPSLTSSFIDGAASWTGSDLCKKSPGLARKQQPTPLLKQALSSALAVDQNNGPASKHMTDSCSSQSSLRLENTKPPPELISSKGNESLTGSSAGGLLTCSVLDPTYFDDESRREGLLNQLAVLEQQTVDENANTDNSVSSSPSAERRKLTPRDRRQADKERYQTYTLNANSVENAFVVVVESGPEAGKTERRDNHLNNSSGSESETNRRLTPRQRRSEDADRFKTQTISPVSNSPVTINDFTEKADLEPVEKLMTSTELTALELDAKVVIRTLKEQSRLSRKNSNSSDLIDECLIDCETLSLVSNESESERSLCVRVRKLSLHQDASESSSSEFVEIRKTRIVRPEDKVASEDPTKGIRGRRRVLYPVRVAPANGRPVSQPVASNQQQQQAGFASPPKNSAPAKISAVSRTAQSPRGRSASPASPSPVRPNRTSALRQNNTSSQKSKSPSVPALESQQQVRLRANSKSPRVSSAPCSPRTLPQPEHEAQQLKRRSLEVTKLSNGSLAAVKTTPPKSESEPAIDPHHPPLASIGKQGTFTKEKSGSPEGASLPGPAREEEQRIPPKVPPKPKLPATKPAVPKKPARFNNGPSPLSSPRSKGGQSPALSRRSVSSASIGSDTTSVTTTYSGADDQSSTSTPQKRTPPKKVVASKIASLWKQVEESRNKQKNEQPDTRKWISRGDSAKPNTEDKAVGHSPEAPQQRPIVSSGTFEKLSSFNSSHQLPVVTSLPPGQQAAPGTSDKRSPPSRLPFKLPRFGRSSQSSTPTTPTLPTPPSPGLETSAGGEAEDKRKFRVTAL